jgi:hypothetical protein
MISVEIVTSPPGVRVVRERDGEVLGVTPVRQPWPRGEGAEALRLERDGYRSKRVNAPLDRDSNLTLDLERIDNAARAKPAPRRRPPEKPAAPSSPPPKPPEPLKI